MKCSAHEWKSLQTKAKINRYQKWKTPYLRAITKESSSANPIIEYYLKITL